MNTNASLWLLFLPMAASPLVYLSGRFAVRLKQPPVLARWLSIIALAVVWLLFGWVAQNQVAGVTLGAVAFRFDGISLFMTCLALTLVSLSLIYSLRALAGAPGEEKFYAALVVMAGAVVGLATTTDLFNLWLWFELMTVASYFLVMFQGGRALEAGVKYLIQSAIGSALVLLGVALVLMYAGSFDLAEIARVGLPTPALMAAGALFVVGFGVKAALVPLHAWLPDAHSQAPAPISALLSGIVIEVALVAMLRALGALGGGFLTWGNLLLGFGAVNMLAGNLLALRQTDVKRLLAYSSISQVGVMLLGFGIAITAGSADGASGAFFQVASHGLAKGLAFLAAGALLYVLNRHTLNRDDLAGAARRYPLVSLCFSVALLSLSGLPPLAGFMGKWQVFAAGLATDNTALWLLVLFAALNSLLSLGYYLPLVNRLYRNTLAPGLVDARPLPMAMTAPLALLALLLLLFGLFPNLLDNLTGAAGQTLMLMFGGAG